MPLAELHDLSIDIGYDLESPTCIVDECTNAAGWRPVCPLDTGHMHNIQVCSFHKKNAMLLMTMYKHAKCGTCRSRIPLPVAWLPI